MNINVAIAGNPNSGKTTLFNALAGTNYHVANYPGVTVEKKSATIQFDDKSINLVDLPGVYSLTPYSLEEKVARDYIVDEKPDLIVQVVDASNIERNLYLTVQLMELGVPLILALNMTDVAEKREILIDIERLSKNLRLPIIPTIARKDKGKEELLKAITHYQANEKSFAIEDFSYGEDIDVLLEDLAKSIEEQGFLKDKYSSRWVALKYIEGDQQVLELGKNDNIKLHIELIGQIKKLTEHIIKIHDTNCEGAVANYRYGIVSSVLKEVITRKESAVDRIFISDRIDRVLTHRYIGPFVLLAILYFSYQFTFWASEYPVAWLESLFEVLATTTNNALPDGLLKSLIVDGIIGGVGGVLGFTPLILFMFFGIAILEDAGYMARVAYMLDRLFRLFGLQGSSVLPYVVSGGIAGGCAVPGVMATRTIKGHKERLLTILTAPFMVCGAKLPVFALLISAFFPGNKGFLLLGVTLLSWLSALIMAKVLGSTIIKGEASSFIMELPPYRFPTMKGLIFHSWEKTWMYVRKAGTTILAMSIILWGLMTFPQLPESERRQFEDQKTIIAKNYPQDIVNEVKEDNEELSEQALKLKKELILIDNQESQIGLRYSLAGRTGILLEPITKYAGFDWRTNIAIIGGIAAKEIVVSTLGTAYSIGAVDPEETGSLATQLAKDPAWDRGVALALIFFTILYAPCFVTVVMIGKETGSRKWGAFTVFGYTGLAFIVAVIVNTIF